VNVVDTDQDRNFWASGNGLSSLTVADIRAADILLVPWENRAGADLSFPNGTTEFYQLLSGALGEKRIDIAVEKESYRELALHANEVRWPSILASAVLLPALGNVLADQVERLVNAPSPTTSIEFSLTGENERGKCVSINYKGPPDRLVETLVEESGRCLSDSLASKTARHTETLKRPLRKAKKR
jgi:hypothetical protein